MGQPKRKRDEEAIERLRELFPVGATVFTHVDHVARSGMSRQIRAYSIRPAPASPSGVHVWDVSGFVARALARRGSIDDGVRCGGCGMDMAFELVYSLAQVLHGDGYALKKEAI